MFNIFSKDKKKEKKTIKSTNGTYSGFVNETGQPSGKGQFTNNQGTIWKGEWKKGEIKFGKMTLTDGSNYEGEFDDSMPNGKGTLVQNLGDDVRGKWSGNFINGSLNGKGEFEYLGGFNNGDKFIGDFKDGEMEGKGEYIWTHGKKYVGEVTNNSITGYGVETLSDGTVTKGKFKDGFLDLEFYKDKKQKWETISPKKKKKYTKYEKFENKIWRKVIDKQLKKVSNRKSDKKKITWDDISQDFVDEAYSSLKKKSKSAKKRKKK